MLMTLRVPFFSNRWYCSNSAMSESSIVTGTSVVTMAFFVITRLEDSSLTRALKSLNTHDSFRLVISSAS
jgi:hypothetical protein